MKRILVLVVVFMAMSIRLARSAEAPALIERPAPDSGPTEISVGMWVVDISSIDSAQQTFTAEIAVVLRWKDPRLAHTGNGVVRYPLEQIWHPRVGIVNETNSVSRKMPDSVEVEPDGTLTYRQLYAGAFTQTIAVAIIPVRSADFSSPAGRGSVSVQRSNVRTGSGLDPRRA
jgi:Neurotransmitter-gated ion-channel ligand binding domain